MRRPSIIVVLAMLGCAAPTPAPTPEPDQPVYPDAEWSRVDPTSAGWNTTGLDSVRATISRMNSSAMVIVDGGRVVMSYGDLTEQSYLASVRKSVLSMLYGIEVAQGRVDTSKSLAQLAIDDRQSLSTAEREATIQDLLAARSGVYHPASNSGDNLADAPRRGSQRHGSYQLYSNWDFNALGTIFEQETGRNIYDAVEAELALPLGMQDWQRGLQRKSGDTTRSRHLAYHMYFSTRDMARLGYLMLRNGRWQDRQIVPADWVRLSTSPVTPIEQMNPAATRRGRFGYGYLWWAYDGAWGGGVYEGAYSGVGAVGQYITVIPKLDLVIAHKTVPRTGSPGVRHNDYWALVDRIVGAKTGSTPAPGPSRTTLYDVLVRGGTVVDGSGQPRYRADVALIGNRIARVDRNGLDPADAAQVIDATGLVVAPGFIDMHTHIEPLLELPDAQSHVRQGVTLALGGPDGSGPFPLADYLDRADRAPLGVNVAYLTGHNTIRREVMGTENRAPTAAEQARMEALVAQEMAAGAFGLSTGLRYVPGYYANTDEVVALSAVAAKAGGIYTSHLREEGVGLIEGVAEALEIGRRAKIPVVLTHHKAIGRHGWGRSALTLAMVDSARKVGTDVMIDQYPYTASFTSLSVLVPPWALAGGIDQLRKRVADPALRDSITRGIVDLIINDRGGNDLRRVQFAVVEWDRTLQGKTLHDWAERRKVLSNPTTGAQLVLEGVLNGNAGMVYHVMDEADVRRIMAHPETMIASDGRITALGDGVPHPRNYGTFPRVLGRYVREEKVLTLEQAVHKMSGKPATRLGLRDYGCVRSGCVADLALFDPATVSDPATFTDPHRYPVGIPWVLVNGQPVIANGQLTEARPGRVVRRP